MTAGRRIGQQQPHASLKRRGKRLRTIVQHSGQSLNSVVAPLSSTVRNDRRSTDRPATASRVAKATRE
ncbi:MAG: hypothetical protein ACKO3V_03445, partial [Pirellula sp.]